MLRPELEARVRRGEELAEASDRRREKIEESIDEAMSSDAIAIPEEVWEDDSVVNHVEELHNETARVKSESTPPPFGRITDSRSRVR